jgi:CheY-like chemotaxis protein
VSPGIEPAAQAGTAIERPARRVVVIDDSPLQCAIWRQLLLERYGERVSVETYTDPVLAVDHLTPDVHLVLLDWEMPKLDGRGVVEEARRRGVNLKRVIITSGHPADELHQVFDCEGCLAVIEKSEPEQQAAFLMILDSMMRR